MFFRADFEKNWQLFKRFFHALPIDGSCTAEASVVSTNVGSETLMTEEFIILTPLLNSGKTSLAEKTNCRCVTVLPGASRNGRKPTEVGAEPVVLMGRGAVLGHFSIQRAVKIFTSVHCAAGLQVFSITGPLVLCLLFLCTLFGRQTRDWLPSPPALPMNRLGVPDVEIR